ncbi:MAG: hypothetical protein HWE39_04565 [Oceanospirillaceae bacterium]|nr:hypothetical protein [Oceanospirillaceae bacterium]
MKTILSVLSLVMLFTVASGITAVASTAYGYSWHNPSSGNQWHRVDNPTGR